MNADGVQLNSVLNPNVYSASIVFKRAAVGGHDTPSRPVMATDVAPIGEHRREGIRLLLESHSPIPVSMM
jgi:hypothetical protein